MTWPAPCDARHARARQLSRVLAPGMASRTRAAQQFDSREAAVGDGGDAPARQPTRGLQQGLPPLRCHSIGCAAGTLASSAQTQPAQGTGASSATQNQRRPEALTKWP